MKAEDNFQKRYDLEARNHFSRINHIHPESVERDRAAFCLDVCENSLNPFGTVHGGALYTLADTACGYAAHSDGRTYVTQEGSLHFLSNRGEGHIMAVASVLHRGKKTCLVNVDITADDGELLASGQFTFFCIKS